MKWTIVNMKWTTVKTWKQFGLSFEIRRAEWPPEFDNMYLIHPYHTAYCIFPAPLSISIETIQSAVVHGGVTYNGIEDDGTHKIGFDCNHGGDEDIPHLMDIDWLTNEVEKLAIQIISMIYVQNYKEKKTHDNSKQ